MNIKTARLTPALLAGALGGSLPLQAGFEQEARRIISGNYPYIAEILRVAGEDPRQVHLVGNAFADKAAKDVPAVVRIDGQVVPAQRLNAHLITLTLPGPVSPEAGVTVSVGDQESMRAILGVPTVHESPAKAFLAKPSNKLWQVKAGGTRMANPVTLAFETYIFNYYMYEAFSDRFEAMVRANPALSAELGLGKDSCTSVADVVSNPRGSSLPAQAGFEQEARRIIHGNYPYIAKIMRLEGEDPRQLHLVGKNFEDPAALEVPAEVRINGQVVAAKRRNPHLITLALPDGVSAEAGLTVTLGAKESMREILGVPTVYASPNRAFLGSSWDNLWEVKTVSIQTNADGVQERGELTLAFENWRFNHFLTEGFKDQFKATASSAPSASESTVIDIMD